MQGYRPFSGDMPSLEDLTFWREAVENGILNRMKALFTNGVVTGLNITEDGGTYYLEAGEAYYGGERICVDAQTATSLTVPDSGANFIFIKYAEETSNPKEHFFTGVETDVYYSDSYSLRVSSSATPQSGELVLASLDATGVLTDLREYVKLSTLLESQGTTASDFYLDYGTTNARKVLTESLQPVTPLNVRLVEVRPIGVSGVEVSGTWRDSNLSVRAVGGEVSANAVCVWKWGWDDIEGIGNANSTFSATNLPEVAENELVGQRLWIPSQSTDYIITANTASSGKNVTITISDASGNLVDLSGLTVPTSNPATIHPNADEYITELRQYSDDGNNTELGTGRRAGFQAMASSPVPQVFEATLPLGARYKLHVYSRRGVTRSANMASSAITRIEFSSELTPSFPSDWSSATVTASATEHGLEIVINASAGVLSALSGFAYGYCLKSVSETVDFTNPEHNPRTTEGVQTTIRLAVDSGGTYVVAVRPLMSGQYVGAAKSAEVTTGGGGHLPNLKALPAINVDLRVTSQGLTWASGVGGGGLVEVTKQGGTAVSASNPAKAVEGRCCVVNYGGNLYVYRVVDVLQTVDSGTHKTYLDLAELTEFGTSLANVFDTEKLATYNGLDSVESAVQMARSIIQVPLDNEIEVTGISFTPTYTDGNPATPGLIRVYQAGQSALATSLEIDSINASVYNEANLQILRSRGNLMLVVDAFEPDSGASECNEVSIRGQLTVHYRDLQQRVLGNDRQARAFDSF